MSRFGFSIEKLRLHYDVPPKMVGVIVAGCVAALGIYSFAYPRHPPEVAINKDGIKITPTRIPETPPKNNVDVPASAKEVVRSTPASNETVTPPIENAPMTDPPKKEQKKKPVSLGYYYQWVRVQGDYGESEFARVRKWCKSDHTPDICRKSQAERDRITLPPAKRRKKV